MFVSTYPTDPIFCADPKLFWCLSNILEQNYDFQYIDACFMP